MPTNLEISFIAYFFNNLIFNNEPFYLIALIFLLIWTPVLDDYAMVYFLKKAFFWVKYIHLRT